MYNVLLTCLTHCRPAARALEERNESGGIIRDDGVTKIPACNYRPERRRYTGPLGHSHLQIKITPPRLERSIPPPRFALRLY